MTNSPDRSSAANEHATWALHKQPADCLVDHKYSFWYQPKEADEAIPVILANAMPEHEGMLQLLVDQANQCGAESNRHSGAVGMEKRAEQSNPGGGHEVTEHDSQHENRDKPLPDEPTPAAGRLMRDAAQTASMREALIRAVDSLAVAELANVFSPRNNALAKSYSEQIVAILAPRLAAQPPAAPVEPFDIMSTIDPDYAESFERDFREAEAEVNSDMLMPAAPVETRHYCQTCCGDGKYDRRLCGLPPEADDTCIDCNGSGIEPRPRSSAATREVDTFHSDKCPTCLGDGYIGQHANSPDVKCPNCSGTGFVDTGPNVELLIENLVQAAAEYENNCDRLVAKTIRVQLEKAKQAIRDAITTQPQTSGWRPIDTAPHEKYVLLGWWDEDQWNCETGWASRGWRLGGVSNMSRHAQATHWQPLPAGPSSQLSRPESK